ncbi:pilus assembly protein PilM [Acinetobacter sichuanensis]|uniref:Pilus assembly protein PilM n=1 Tax=Acinetobacter sichuanensis TaxID=2136183 RepID=A0A371YPW8_9GAMM|nr:MULTISPECIES: pilus assembly protein PilM [Acinetobacter]MDM1249035.1 pilus assembly protein PilM [Acinetobacter sp. R933-2]MDM1765088.1 pilus assembly protein PilM [Acinetobacter sp. 226-1]MDM1768564.1 pilus assembly protein PilM [Acinetobacter sp. 226-4]MDQ9022268.1 pilus assembly protein PilM [Acinetobacter sichuanensis]RFC83520.1 pilus assembly protein PilM [Acinetobacter sichuanensis]
MLRISRKQVKGLIGVDISSTSVKILELSVKNGRYWVESYGLSPLLDGSVVEKNILNPEAVSDALERAVNLANPHSMNAAVAVTNSMVIQKVIEMDADMNDDEREVQIRMDAEQYIPFPLDEVSLDFEVLPDKLANPNRVNVVLVATRTENVDSRVEVLEMTGLTAKVADTESYCIERAFEVFSDTLPMGANMVGILDIGHTMTTLSVMQNGKIIYTREQVFGGKQLTQDVQSRYGLSFEEAGRAKKDRTLPDDYETEVLIPFLEAVVQQAARSLQFFFSSSQFNEIDHILLAGGNANIPGLAKLLQQKLGYRVTVANPFLQMGFSPQIDLKKIENDAPSLMVACGLAMRSFD